MPSVRGTKYLLLVAVACGLWSRGGPYPSRLLRNLEGRMRSVPDPKRDRKYAWCLVGCNVKTTSGNGHHVGCEPLSAPLRRPLLRPTIPHCISMHAPRAYVSLEGGAYPAHPPFEGPTTVCHCACILCSLSLSPGTRLRGGGSRLDSLSLSLSLYECHLERRHPS